MTGESEWCQVEHEADMFVNFQSFSFGEAGVLHPCR